MIKFILSNWRYRKGRTSLLLAGALIISLGLGYLVGLAETSRGTINENLEERWSLSYDILVRPQGAADPIEEQDNVVEPNFLSTLAGGISLDEWRRVQEIPGVEVAAPVAMLGTVFVHLFPEIELTDWQEGYLYRMTVTQSFSDGASTHEIRSHKNYHWGLSSLAPTIRESDDFEKVRAFEETYGFADELWRARNPDGSLKDAFLLPGNLYLDVLVAAVDPEAEAALVGLDRATRGQYFGEPEDPFEREQRIRLPLLATEQMASNLTVEVTLERLPLAVTSESLEELKELGGPAYLATLSGESVAQRLITPEDLLALSPNPVDFAALQAELGSTERPSFGLNFRNDFVNLDLNNEAIAPLNYQRAEHSPFAENWPNVYQVRPVGAMGLYSETKDTPYYALFRHNEDGGRLAADLRDQYVFQVVGTFDPLQLSIKDDPLTELPMETYRPATATLRLDPAGRPVNPPVPLLPSPNPRGLLTSPPVYLTDIASAALIAGDRPISAIRVKVAGAETLSEESQRTLEEVAQAITAATGLRTDIMAGSSPRRVLVEVLGYTGELEDGTPVNAPPLGFIEQPWALKGANISIFREARLGYSALLGSVLLVATVYVLVTSTVSVLSRRKELAVLAVTGWRPSHLFWLVTAEGLLVGVAVATGAVALGLLAGDVAGVSLGRLLLAAGLAFAVYLVGALLPAIGAARLQPWAILRSGELAVRRGGRFTLTSVLPILLSNLIGRRRRYLLSLVAMALPTALLLVFTFITLRLEGELFLSWLGEYIALEVGPLHYAAALTALVISLIATADIVWINVLERHSELALLHALGWRPGMVLRSVIYEGALLGFIAGLVGYSLGLSALTALYGPPPSDFALLSLLILTAPVLTGSLGALIPGLVAGRLQPGSLLRSD